MTTPDPAVEHARTLSALFESAARAQRAARHAEERATELLAIARRIIRQVDAALERRALELYRRR